MAVIKMLSANKYRVRIEGPKELENSFFKGVYATATMNTKEIIQNTIAYNQADDDNYEKQISIKEFNNIIAFIGERGAGKTSAMVSYTQFLKSDETEKLKWLDCCELNYGKDYFTKSKFCCLDIIDPSMFEQNESIFEIILAQMFERFTKKCNSERIDNFSRTKEIFDEFSNTYDNLKTLHEKAEKRFNFDSNSEFNIETLSRLSASSKTKKQLIELVQKFLEFDLGKENEVGKNFLVIPIDDLDMDIKYAMDMVEQIRKYFVMPNVIILMAIKLSQLTDIVEQNYIESFKTIIGKKHLSDSTEKMAAKYVEKLIPGDRKIFLPELRMNDGNRADITKAIFDEESQKKFNDNKEEDLDTVEDSVLRLINEKTGLLFFKPKPGVHYLIPNNLRELHNFIALLQSMNEYKNFNYSDKIRVIMENIEKFEQYFINNWIKSNITSEKARLVKEFCYKELEQKNYFVIQKINEDIVKNFEKERVQGGTVIQSIYVAKSNESRMTLIQSINEKAYDVSNISLGDVLTVLQYFCDLLPEEENEKFSFVFKVLYSVMIKKLLLDQNHRSQLSKMLGGSIYGILAKKFIRNKKYSEFEVMYDKISIDYKVTNGETKSKTLKEMFDIIYEKYKTTGELSELTEYIQVIECLHYFLYIGELKPLLRKEALYFNAKARFGFAATTKARFNIGAIFFNVFEHDYNLDRIFEQTFLEQPSENEESYKKFKKCLRDVSLSKMFDDVHGNCDGSEAMLLPFYSIDMIEKFLADFNNDYKESADNNLSVYINHFISQLIDFIEDYYMENSTFLVFEVIKRNTFKRVIDYVFDECRIGMESDDLLSLFKKNFTLGNAMNKEKIREKIEQYFNEISKKENRDVLEEVEEYTNLIDTIEEQIRSVIRSQTDKFDTESKREIVQLINQKRDLLFRKLKDSN